jgi:hypothetical protein
VLIEKALDATLAVFDPPRKGKAHKTTVGRGTRELKVRGILKDIFPLHVDPDHQYYMTRQTVVNEFCSVTQSYKSAFIYTKKSKIFIGWIRDYFGEKIALYFAFLHFYNHFIFYLAVLGLGPAIWQYASVSLDIFIVISSHSFTE